MAARDEYEMCMCANSTENNLYAEFNRIKNCEYCIVLVVFSKVSLNEGFWNLFRKVWIAISPFSSSNFNYEIVFILYQTSITTLKKA